MGWDAGFDMVPRLSRGVTDQNDWARFIHFIEEHYKDDQKVEKKSTYIVFKAGEHPMLPFEGHKLLRFSSKVTGSTAYTTGVEDYIDTVTRAARTHFGSRVQYWNEGYDEFGKYTWDEVHESFKSYEQPDEPKIHTSITSFISGNDPIKNLDIPLFEVKDISGKGKGLAARFNISKGTRIIFEKPLITLLPMEPANLEVTIAKLLRELPRDAQRQFLSLHNNFPGKSPFSGIFKTNALPCGPQSPVGAIYPTICLINHSCDPNSHHSWNNNTKHETVHAIRPINAGEEITIAYDKGDPSIVRRDFLKRKFGFDCNCNACSRPPADMLISDARRVLIQKLDDAIGDPFRLESAPHDSLKDCRSLLKYLDYEYDGHAIALSARLYYDALQVAIAHGDQARASVFADRAYKARLVIK